MYIQELNCLKPSRTDESDASKFERALAPLFTCTWTPPEGVATRGVVLLVHGMESHSGWFELFAPHLAAQGYRVHAYDRAGWGRSPGTSGHLNRAEDALEELERAANAAASDGLPLHGVSLSWGGLVLASALDALPGRFASATLFVPPLYCQHLDSPLARLRAVFSALAHGDELTPLACATEDFARDVGLRGWIAADQLRCKAVTNNFIRQSARLLRMARHALRHRGKDAALLLVTDEDPLVATPQIKKFAAKHAIRCEAVSGCRHSLVLEAPEAMAHRVHSEIEQRENLDVQRMQSAAMR